jgi:hypothetical protein
MCIIFAFSKAVEMMTMVSEPRVGDGGGEALRRWSLSDAPCGRHNQIYDLVLFVQRSNDTTPYQTVSE